MVTKENECEGVEVLFTISYDPKPSNNAQMLCYAFGALSSNRRRRYAIYGRVYRCKIPSYKKNRKRFYAFVDGLIKASRAKFARKMGIPAESFIFPELKIREVFQLWKRREVTESKS